MKKVNMKEVMQKAHEIAKKLEGDYQARLALALRMVWAAVKEEVVVTKVAITKKNEWKKYGKHRIYFECKVTYIFSKIGFINEETVKMAGYVDVVSGKTIVNKYGSRIQYEAFEKAAKYIAA